jgi:hypothetical protein
MHVVQTPGPPPNHGKMYFPMRGCTWKSRNAPVKIVSAYAVIRSMVAQGVAGMKR